MKNVLLLTGFLLALVAPPAEARSISPSKAKKFLETQLPAISQEVAELRVKVTYRNRRSKKLTTDVASDKVRCHNA
jgi:hypothetical protein